MFKPTFREASQDRVKLIGDSAKSMEIWLRALHEVPQLFSVGLEEMWHLFAACDKYDLDITLLNTWFAECYGLHNIEQYYRSFGDTSEDKTLLDPRSLLFPCWRFDHAKGFMRASRFLVYDSIGHVTEWNPTD